VQAAAIMGEAMDKIRETTVEMDKSRRMLQTAIYLYFRREGNEIQGS
jgi:hypothetical protein